MEGKDVVTGDEQAIRDTVAEWMEASRRGDTSRVLELMADDIVFLTVGAPPFGKKEFEAMSRQMTGAKFDGSSDIQEIQVLGNWAWMRNHLTVSITGPDGKTVTREGNTLTILQKNDQGNWVIKRDANLMPGPGGA